MEVGRGISFCALLGVLVLHLAGGAACFALGVWLGGTSGHWRLFAAVGLLGSFTTFSSFLADVWTLAAMGTLPAALYVVGTVAPGLFAGAAGLGAGRRLLLRPIGRTQKEGDSREDYR